MKKEVLLDVKGIPYTFKFDEKTTAQTKKQYDACLQCWSPAKNEITNAYCGSVSIGHCTSKNLVHHCHEFEESLGLDSAYLLDPGMDGLNLNETFSNVLAVELEEKQNIQFLKFGTCFLHPVHTA